MASSVARKPVVLLCFFLLPLVSATCYWPNGQATYGRDLYEHMPCSNDTTSPLATICCALNRTNPSGGDKIYGRTNDECLPNGICRNRVLDHGTMQVSYWRETCTEQDWKKGLCQDICSDDWTSGNGTTGAVMTPCDGKETSLRWCCGVNTDCCKDESKVKVLPFEFRGALPNTASATPRPLPTSTSSPSPSATASTSSTGLSTGAKAGIGVGASVGALLLIGLGFLLARRTGQQAAATHAKNAPDDAAGPGQYSGFVPPVPEKESYRYELEPRSRTELPYSPASPLSPLTPPGRGHTPSYEMPS